MTNRGPYQIIDVTDHEEPINYCDTMEEAIECAKMMFDQSHSDNPIIRVFYYDTPRVLYELKR